MMIMKVIKFTDDDNDDEIQMMTVITEVLILTDVNEEIQLMMTAVVMKID